MQLDQPGGLALPAALAKWAALLAVLASAALWNLPARGETATLVPPPAVDAAKPGAGRTQTAVLAGGCFWGVQGVYQHVKGVTRAVSGYAGGGKGTAIYEAVGMGNTGHAESVEVTFDHVKDDVVLPKLRPRPA